MLKKTRAREMSKRSAANEPHPQHELHKQNQNGGGGGCQRRQLRGRGWGLHLMWAKRPHLRIIVYIKVIRGEKINPSTNMAENWSRVSPQ